MHFYNTKVIFDAKMNANVVHVFDKNSFDKLHPHITLVIL